MSGAKRVLINTHGDAKIIFLLEIVYFFCFEKTQNYKLCILSSYFLQEAHAEINSSAIIPTDAPESAHRGKYKLLTTLFIMPS